jgi:NTE family protein
MTVTQAPLLSSLPDEALARIERAARSQVFAPGDIIVAEREEREEISIIRSGEAIVTSHDSAGATRQLAQLGAGDCFGELSMISGEPASATVQALTATELWTIAHADFMAIARDTPQLSQNLAGLLVSRIVRANQRYLEARDGRLIICSSTAPEPWCFKLVHHLAASVAHYTNAPVILLDHSGLAADRLPPAMVGVPEEQAGSGHASESARVARVVVVDGSGAADWPTSEVERMLKRTRHLLVFTSAAPEAGALRQADIDLRIETEQTAELWEPSSATIAALRRESMVAPLRRDVLRAAARLGISPEDVAVIPGGEAALIHDGAQLPPITKRSIDSLARRVAGLRVGLALGGGGAKGFAHVGVLRALERIGVPIDCIAGCSIGAPLAASFAAGWPTEQIGEQLRTISAKAIRPNVPVHSLLTSRSVRAEIERASNDRTFEDLPIPLAIVSVDIRTGEEVLIRSGPIWRAIMASMAFPGIYQPVRHDGRYLVDGAVVNPVPVTAVQALGADVVISSNLGGHRRGPDEAPDVPRPASGEPLILNTIARSLEIMQRQISVGNNASADVVITSRFDNPPGLLDFKRGRDLEHAGEQAVDEALPRLQAALPWLA